MAVFRIQLVDGDKSLKADLKASPISAITLSKAELPYPTGDAKGFSRDSRHLITVQ